MVSGGIRASTPMPRLAEWLESKSGMAPELQATLQCVAAGAVKLARRISTGGLIEPLGSELGENTGGDTQKALDVLADDWFMAALTPSPVRWYASEEQDEVVELNPGGTIALAIDPLDRNIWRERGLLHYQEDHWEAASYSLRRYFYLSGQLMVAHGLSETERAEPISHPLPADDEQVLEIFFQIEEMRKRIN